MVGCPHGAKNTLVKNYLWFAERAGARCMPERTVVDIRPLGAPDGRDGYAVTTERSGAWVRRERQTLTARGVVVAAGALGHEPAARARAGSTARCRSISTGSASSCARTRRRSSPSRCPRAAPDIQRRVAITGSIYPDPDTHIETVVYGDAGDGMSPLFTLLTGRRHARSRGR